MSDPLCPGLWGRPASLTVFLWIHLTFGMSGVISVSGWPLGMSASVHYENVGSSCLKGCPQPFGLKPP